MPASTNQPADANGMMMLIVHRLEELSKQFNKMEEKLEANYARREDFLARHDAFEKKLDTLRKEFKDEIESIHADQRWVIKGALAAGGSFLVLVIMAVIKSGLIK